MLKKLAQIALITISLSAVSLNASAETMMDSVHSLQTQWAEIKYQTFDEDDQVKKLTALADEAKTLSESHPNDAEPKIWYGIILSTRAGVKGGLGALKDVKHAKKLFEDAPEKRVIDLSADFRLNNLETYEQWYGHAHQARLFTPPK